MKIEIDIEKMVSKSIVDGVLKSDSIQEEVENVLKSEEYKKCIKENIKVRLDEILISEEGKKQLDDVIISEIAQSESIKNFAEKILESDKYRTVLQQEIKACLQKLMSSEEGKDQISCMVKEYLENYDIDWDDNFSSEINKGISDILITIIRNSFKKIKEQNME